ncbi:HTH domain-containing protein [Haloferax chudinovii]|uniref:HTH domain-containing protein n=1 Tax=Haloferax chudinovii TaxID=1109010 RepID=A0ABD5XI23_9EURY
MQTNGERRVELWIRPIRDGLGEEHQALIVRLERLTDGGVVDDVCVRTWGRNVDVESDLAPTNRDAVVRERLAECRHWARTEEVALPTLDERSTVGSGRMGPEHDAVVLPRTLGIVFRGDEIEAVFPHERDEGTQTFADWVETAESFLGIDHEHVEV